MIILKKISETDNKIDNLMMFFELVHVMLK
jgi:hypothetical protein